MLSNTSSSDVHTTHTYKHTKQYKIKYRRIFYLCSSPPSPLLLSTILHRSEATSSFCWSVRLRLGSCSWQALLSDRLNSRYGTKACWSSSQYSRLHGTWKERQTTYICDLQVCILFRSLYTLSTPRKASSITYCSYWVPKHKITNTISNKMKLIFILCPIDN